MTMIGIDPHKATHTAVAIDDNEAVLDEFTLRASAVQAQRLRDWAAGFDQRRWAVESANGLGYLVAQQLVVAGETVFDVCRCALATLVYTPVCHGFVTPTAPSPPPDARSRRGVGSARMSPTASLPPDVTGDEAEILWTAAGRPFVRTSDEAFADLPDFPWSPNYAEVDGMRMHYVDAGDPAGEVVLLLHGQPDWSYLYRRMIPILADAGLRVIAPDHIGFGRSDKPVQLDDYTFLQHVAWNEEFLDALGLRDISPVVQDWGSLIGLRCVGNDPDRFARIVVANGNLPVMPEGFAPFPMPDSLEPQDLEFPFVVGGGGGGMGVFGEWIAYAMVGRGYMPSVVMRGSIRRGDITEAEIAAYDAPFPTRLHMAGTRTFPSLVNTLGQAPTNEAARAALDAFPRPVLGMFGLKDPIFGDEATRDATRVQIAGAAGQPHHDFPDAGHFIQEDAGPDLAERIVDWIQQTPLA